MQVAVEKACWLAFVVVFLIWWKMMMFSSMLETKTFESPCFSFKTRKQHNDGCLLLFDSLRLTQI